MLKNIKGLKYPDEHLVRFFFKEKLNQSTGSVLELGCGNGNNLTLFAEYNWNVIGIDINNKLIDAANSNFQLLNKNNFQFQTDDMVKFIENYHGEEFDCFLLPSSLYYLSEEKIVELLKLIQDKKILKKRCFVYFRVRLDDDFRLKRAKKIGNKTYKLNFMETGELNCINTFFKEKEFVNLLKKYFTFFNFKKFRVKFENFQNNSIIDNSDLIVWGRLK